MYRTRRGRQHKRYNEYQSYARQPIDNDVQFYKYGLVPMTTFSKNNDDDNPDGVPVREPLAPKSWNKGYAQAAREVSDKIEKAIDKYIGDTTNNPSSGGSGGGITAADLERMKNDIKKYFKKRVPDSTDTDTGKKRNYNDISGPLTVPSSAPTTPSKPSSALSKNIDGAIPDNSRSLPSSNFVPPEKDNVKDPFADLSYEDIKKGKLKKHDDTPSTKKQKVETGKKPWDVEYGQQNLFLFDRRYSKQMNLFGSLINALNSYNKWAKEGTIDSNTYYNETAVLKQALKTVNNEMIPDDKWDKNTFSNIVDGLRNIRPHGKVVEGINVLDARKYSDKYGVKPNVGSKPFVFVTDNPTFEDTGIEYIGKRSYHTSRVNSKNTALLDSSDVDKMKKIMHKIHNQDRVPVSAKKKKVNIDGAIPDFSKSYN